jgi:hypothetical protein
MDVGSCTKGFVMIGGMNALPGRIARLGSLLTLTLAGCITLPGALPDTSMPRLVSRPRPPAAPSPAPELRIPGDPVQVAEATDIPLVPLPPPPFSRPANPQPAPQSAPRPAPQPAPPPAPPASPPVVPAAAAVPTAPPAVQAPTAPTHTARQIVQQAAARYAGIDSYIARLVRREQVKGKDQPEEILLFKFRKQPWSVHFKWLGETARGREVLYVKDRHENKIHTLLAAGDVPLMPAGKRFSVALDSIFVRSASRYPITEAGIGASIERLQIALDAQDRGDQQRGTFTALPLQQRPEFAQPVEAIEQIIPPGRDPDLPRGGRRLYCFDPDWHLPLLVVTRDAEGHEVEYYRYDRLQAPLKLDDDDFDPDKLWPNTAGGKQDVR